MRGSQFLEKEIQNAASAIQIGLILRGLESCQMRLNGMHVRIQPAIGRKRRPVRAEFIRETTMFFFPVACLENLCHVGKQAIRIRMTRILRGGGGEQNKDVTISELRVVRRCPVTINRREIAAVLGIAMRIPKEGHARINHIITIGKTKLLCESEGMNHARCSVNFLRPVSKRGTLEIRHIKSAIRAQHRPKEVQLRLHIVMQECAVHGVIDPKTIPLRITDELVCCRFACHVDARP